MLNNATTRGLSCRSTEQNRFLSMRFCSQAWATWGFQSTALSSQGLAMVALIHSDSHGRNTGVLVATGKPPFAGLSRSDFRHASSCRLVASPVLINCTSSKTQRQSLLSNPNSNGQRARPAAYPRLSARESNMSCVPIKMASRSGQSAQSVRSSPPISKWTAIGCAPVSPFLDAKPFRGVASGSGA